MTGFHEVRFPDNIAYGAMGGPGFATTEVRAGLFDGAGIALSFVNWQDPDTYGEIRLRRGTLGDVRLTPQGHFTAELRGLSQPLAQSTLQIYGPACRADLGDGRCRFPIKPPLLAREQAVELGEFYRIATAAGTGWQVYEDRIYEVTAAGTTDAVQPTYDTTIGNPTIDGTAELTARDSFMRSPWSRRSPATGSSPQATCSTPSSITGSPAAP